MGRNNGGGGGARRDESGDEAGKPWGQSAKARHNPAGSGRMKPGEVAFFFSLYEKNRWPWY